MKRPKDMTPEELDALPEIPLVEYYEHRVVTQKEADERGVPVGHTIRRPKVRKTYVQATEPDDLAFWTDSDGNMWMPVRTEHGWGKRAWL